VQCLLSKAAWIEPQFVTAMKVIVDKVNSVQDTIHLIDMLGINRKQHKKTYRLPLRSMMQLDDRNEKILVRAKIGMVLRFFDRNKMCSRMLFDPMPAR
jgi:hypothetical protein